MTQAPVAASLRTRVPKRTLVVSEARRAWNREHVGRVAELHCECEQPGCTEWVPAIADAHRGPASYFLVTPEHFDNGVVVKAADRFFIVAVRN